MLTLLVEACTERGIVAIYKEERQLFYEELPFGYNNSSYLMPAIKQGLSNAAIALQNLGCIAVGVGPGSYTGIRVSAAVVKAFSYACQIPLVGLSTLNCFVPDDEGSFALLIDAKIGGVYFIAGEVHNGNVNYCGEAQLLSLEKIDEHLAGITKVISPNSQRLRSLIPNITWIEMAPNPKRMLKLAQTGLKEGKYSLDGTLELNYMRKTQAELEREK